MSGHSKWATTKRAKAVVDAKRGASFTKYSKLITIAARTGGDPTSNFTLRMAIEKARGVNMPKDNIEKAIKRGTGELEGATIEELVYEGIGPAKSQFIIKCLTDSKNRSASEIRHLFSEHGGSLGSVMWNFEIKGVIQIAAENLDADKMDELELEIIDAGAEDILNEVEGMTIYTKPENLQKVNNFLVSKNIKAESAEIAHVAKELNEASDADKEKIEKFIIALEENEDVSEYYHNIANA
jgi:YebC/PmpR family DNA-binding regulatory protein